MRQIITTARFDAHLSNHSFDLFARQEREFALEDANFVQTCDCCGEEILTHVIEREILVDADWDDYRHMELCSDCNRSSVEKIIAGYRVQHFIAEQRKVDRWTAMRERIRALEAKNPGANWDEVYHRLRIMGYHFQRTFA